MPRKATSGQNDVKTLYPKLMLDWDYKKNSIDPSTVLPGSGIRINWKCHKCGQCWDAVLCSRVNGKGCPYCAGLRPIKGKTDLATMYPEVAIRWNYSKNHGLTPSDVTYASTKNVWWTCEQGHEYEQKIKKKTLRGSGCPICSGHRTVVGVNDFGTVYPEIAKEWHPTKNGDKTPAMFSPKNGYKAWWKCKYGHEWQTSIHDRSSGTGCPLCKTRFSTSYAEQAIYFYVRKLYPDAISRYKDLFNNQMELDVYIPSKKVAIEYDGANWHNSNTSHEREKFKYETCQANEIFLIRVKEHTKEAWHDVANTTYYLKSHDRNELQRIIQDILDKLDSESNLWSRKNSNKLHSKIVVDFNKDNNEILSYLRQVPNSLVELRPDLVDEWHPTKNGDLKPEYFGINSNEKVWWKCKVCQHDWKTTIIHRAGKRNSGCPECAKAISGKTFTKVMIQSRGSLFDHNPEICKEWDYEKNTMTPDKVMVNTNKKYWWKCKECGYSWESSPNNRCSKGVGCPHCSGRVPMPGIDDFKTLFPNLASEWDYERNQGKNPEQYLPKSGIKVWWKCPICGHRWENIIRNRVNTKGLCPNCKSINNATI